MDNDLQSYWVMQSIKLDSCRIKLSGLEAFGNSTSVKELSLHECFGVTDGWLSSFVQMNPELRKLDIGYGRGIRKSAVDCLTKSCTSLTSLHMESCYHVPREAYVSIGQHCQLLDELNLTKSRIDDEGLKLISRCSHLAKLCLRDCSEISDDGISVIGMCCPKLRGLSVSRCKRLTDVGIAAIALGCPALEYLDMSYCNKVTDTSLLSLSRCSRLKFLVIRGCLRVTSVGLSAIAEGCRQLFILNIYQCSNITDDGMRSLARNTRNLMKINLAYCSVTDEGLLALARISRLQEMTISNVAALTPNGVAAALLTCGGLIKVKLDASFKSSLHRSLLSNMEARGAVFHWINKPRRLPMQVQPPEGLDRFVQGADDNDDDSVENSEGD